MIMFTGMIVDVDMATAMAMVRRSAKPCFMRDLFDGKPALLEHEPGRF